MRVSRSIRYATDLMIEIAETGVDSPVSIDAVARKRSLPASFLKHLAATLARAGLLIAHPGSHGGYVLTPSAESITLRNIVEAIEGPFTSPSGGAEPETGEELWTQLAREWAAALEKYTLDDIIRLCDDSEG